jgi:proteic killer suppression protein
MSSAKGMGVRIPPAHTPVSKTGGRIGPFGASRIRRSCALITLGDNNAIRYYSSVIRSFRSAKTEKIFLRERLAKLPPDVQRRAHRKLLLLDAAETLQDLRVPPENRLERLAGNRDGQHSIRINDQWRICFEWNRGDAYDVEITDYH